MDDNIFLRCVLPLLLVGIAISQQQGPENGLIVSTYGFFFEVSHLISYPGDVDNIKSDTNNKYFFNNSFTDVMSIAVDTENQSMYYLDMRFQGIYRLRNANVSLKSSAIKEEPVHEGISPSVGTVAFDWISKNLYWTDRYHNWIAMRPAYSNDSLMYRVMLDIQIIVPVGLAIDPLAGLMFWSDTMPLRRIERSTLLGENRTVVIYQSMQFVTAIAVDHVAQQIYWIDAIGDSVDAASYDGLRKPIRRLNGMSFFGLALYQDYICATSSSDNSVGCMDKENGEIKWSDTYSVFSWPQALAVYDKTTQPPAAINYCEIKKCHHFCASTPKGPQCMCKEGYKLQNDRLTCKASHVLDKKGLMFTNGSHICVFDIHVITEAKHKPECILANLTGISRFIQTDNAKGHIYFWNATGKEIRKIDTVTKSITFVASTSPSVSGMVYDWIDDSIIWSENDTGSIKRVYLRNLDSNFIFTNIKGVSYLTANPHNGTMYWISGSDDSYLIEGGTKYGTGRYTVLPSKSVKKPSNLFYDEIYEGLYFVDEEEVKNMKTNGSDVENRMAVGGTPLSFLVYKDYTIWTNGKGDIRVAFVLASGTDSVIKLTEHNSVLGICAFDPRLQRQTRGPCEDGNGGCQHICIHKQNGYECQCPVGLKIDTDKKRCKSDVLSNNYALITDYTHDRIYQIPTDKPFDINNIVAIDVPSIYAPHAALYDAKSDYLYWVEFDYQRIRRARMTGENETTLITFKSHYPDRIIFDESTGNLYFTALIQSWFSDEKSYIGVLSISPDTTDYKHKKLIENLEEPRCLALYPKKGLMFWGESSDTSPYIARSYMDGSNASIIIKSDIEWPVGLTIDYRADRLYWADLGNDVIKSATLDGKDVKTFITDKRSNPGDLMIQGQFLYYIGWNKRSITKVSLTDGSAVQWMPEVAELGRLDSIYLYPPQPQPVNEACSIKAHNHGCSTFCFPFGHTGICGCEDGVKKRDSRHCENVCRNDMFEYVKIQRDCVIREGGKCGYTCVGHLSTNKRIPKIQCLPNGTWDQPESVLCDKTVCSSSLPDVYLTKPCSTKIGDKCMYSCKDTALQKVYNSMKCSSGGVWVPGTNLCKAPVAMKCPSDLKNGILAKDCSRLAVNTECKFRCNDGYTPPQGIDTMVCHRDGKWSFDISTLCSAIPSDVGMMTAEQQAIAVGGGLGSVAIIMIIVVVVLLVCFLRKSKPKKQDKEVLEPESINVSRRGSERQSYPKSTGPEYVSSDPTGAYVTIARQTPSNVQETPKPQAIPKPQEIPKTQALPTTQAIPRPQATTATNMTFKATTKPEDPYTQPGRHASVVNTQPGMHKSVINIGKPAGNPYERF